MDWNWNVPFRLLEAGATTSVGETTLAYHGGKDSPWINGEAGTGWFGKEHFTDMLGVHYVG